ncbi:MAG TPA: aminotransferase class I/II-fold pyridoxal phosphate-dependent enzyme, partial [Acidobacteriota bacterium]|nr:aminotransferase class I/II-fold pyridoxal phosphate-dependent enzyme [Acidobacteriota bacterium]
GAVVESRYSASLQSQPAALHSHSRTPSFWGRYPKLIITNGLSKAYGLPGLRIGWIATFAEMAERLWSYHDYTTIAMGMLSERIATVALSAEVEPKILERTRKIIRENYPIIRQWLHAQGIFEWTDPQAGAIVYTRYRSDLDSVQLVESLRKEKSVLVVPGAHFLMDNHLRFGFGSEPEKLRAGLDRIAGFLKKVASRDRRYKVQSQSPERKNV